MVVPCIAKARYYHVATRFLPCCYHVARYVGPTGDREHPACSGGWLGLGGAQSRRDCITQPGVAHRALPRVRASKRPPTLKGLYRCLPHPSPFLQPSPQEVALQIVAAWDIPVRFEVECARGADTNVRAPIAQWWWFWGNPRCLRAGQGCIKLATKPTLGRNTSPRRPCLGGNGRFGEAPLPCVRAPHRA